MTPFKRLLLVGILSLFSLFGCARSLTTPTQALKLDLRITFKGTIDTTRYRYYVLFSSSAFPTLPNFGTSEYMPTPGNGYNENDDLFRRNDGGISYYYQHYFSTWMDYIATYQSTLYLNPSGASAFVASQNATYAPVSRTGMTFEVIGGNQIHLQIPLSYLSQDSGRLYIDIMTTDIRDTTDLGQGKPPSGQILDHLHGIKPTLVTGIATFPAIRGDESTTLDNVNDAANIQSWEAYTF